MQNSEIQPRDRSDRRAPWVAPEAEPFSLADAGNTSNSPNSDSPGSTFRS